MMKWRPKLTVISLALELHSTDRLITALYTAKTENLLHQVHASVQSHRSQNKKELSDVNKTLAVIEQQRRANDHHLPINNQPIRTVEDTKQCGVSSCQVLEGEDNSSATRKRQQQEQMRLWCLLGARERHQKQQQQKNEAEYVSHNNNNF